MGNAEKKKTRYTIETAHAVAARFAGKFLDPEFRGAKHRHQWATRDGIVFARSLEDILATKRFVPFAWQTEMLCRCLLQAMFGTIFPKLRPRFLTDANGIPRELDGYAEELNLAFEYHGEQHVRFNPHFHDTPKDCEKQKQVDQFKLRRCKEHGIHLIVIPHNLVGVQAIRECVLTFCKEHGITVKSPNADVPVEKISILEELRPWAAISKGIEILDARRHEVRGKEILCRCCSCGKSWWAILATVKQALRRGSGCVECRMKKTRRKDPRIKKYEDFIALAAQKGTEFLDKDIPARTDLKANWKCKSCGKAFPQSYQRVQAGFLRCMKCTGKSRITIEQMRQWAQRHGGRCLTQSLPEGGKTMVEFVDETGTHFFKTATDVKNGCPWPTKRKKVPKHSKEYRKEMADALNLQLVDPNQDYKGNTARFRVRCKKAGHEFSTNLRQLQRHRRLNSTEPLCPTCHGLARLTSDS